MSRKAIDLSTRPVRVENGVLPLGFEAHVSADRVIAWLPAQGSVAKKWRQQAYQEGRLIDLTRGRKTRTILVMDSNHLILSAVSAETVRARMEELKKKDQGEVK